MNQRYNNIQKYLFKYLTVTSLVLTATVPLSAQEAMDQMTQLMNRMATLEEENRELRGRLEETQHELSTLSKQMDTLNADIDYRLNNPESGIIHSENNAMLSPLPPSSLSSENVASQPSGDVEQDYEKARTFLEQGDYEAAERSFAAFVASHPKDKLAGSAQYWLGVTYFVRGNYEKAVTAFAKGYKNYPQSPKAADNLLKLAKSLSALDRKADACTTLDQLISEHPQFSTKDVMNERKNLNCK